MKSVLEAIKTKLEALQEKAEGYADSENEKTTERYADVPDYLASAIDALDEAITCLEGIV